MKNDGYESGVCGDT